MADSDNKVLYASLGAVGGALAARTLDEALPDTKLFTFGLGAGREASIRPSAALGIAAIVAGIAGVKIPGGAAVLGMGAGMLAYEATMEVGDDLAALVLGLPAPAAAPVAGLPAPAPAAPAAFYPYQAGGVPDWSFNAAMNGLNQQFG